MSMLSGLRVLDAGRILAAPLAGQILADMGAEVLKVEPPEGDATRKWGPPFQNGMAAYYQCVNRNKSSLVIDFKSAEGMARLHELAAKADVFIHNLLPSKQEKFGLTRELMQQRHPHLISMGVSGFREGTERENDPGYDAMLQAESGIMSLNGPKDGDPYKVGVAWIDVLTGMTAANGILGALYQRSRTGRGAFLNVSLMQTALFSLINVGSAYHLTQTEPRRHGNEHPTIVPYQLFQLKDRPLVIAVGNDRQYAGLCEALGLEVDYAANPDRVVHREQVLARLERVLCEWTTADLLPQLQQRHVPASPVFTVAESFQRAMRWDSNAVLAVKHPEVGDIMTTDFPVTGFRRSNLTPPPLLNEGGEELARRWLEAST